LHFLIGLHLVAKIIIFEKFITGCYLCDNLNRSYKSIQT